GAFAARPAIALAVADEPFTADQLQPLEPAGECAVEKRLRGIHGPAEVLLLRSRGNDVVNEPVGGDALGIGFEAEDDAMPQGGQGHGANIVEGHVVAAFEQTAYLGAEDDRLESARARPIACEALDLGRC